LRQSAGEEQEVFDLIFANPLVKIMNEFYKGVDDLTGKFLQRWIICQAVKKLLRYHLCVVSLCALTALVACGGQEQEEVAPATTYTEPEAASYAVGSSQKEAPPLSFVDITATSGIDFVHENGAAGKKWMPETMGSGCALFDYDGDGDLDALLVNGRRWDGTGTARTKLYANSGTGSFVDVTQAAGLNVDIYGMGVAVADYDGDGDLDLYLTAQGPNVLLRNDGGRFVDVSAQAGVAGVLWKDEQGRENPEWSTGAVWADVDGDGWLDLLVTNYVRWSAATDIYTSLDGKAKSYATPQQYPGSTPRLYRNLGDGTFADRTREAGLFLPEGKSMGVAMTDFEGDGLIDLVVTNDTQPNFLLHNLGGGRFEERGLMAGIGYDDTGRARAGMGVDIASVENDGVQSIAIGNFSREALSLYRQAGEVFVDAAGKAKLVQSTLRPLTFGLRFFDADLDGYLDLLLANGHIEPEINSVQKEIHYAQASQLFWNSGDGRLVDVSEQAGSFFAEELVARGLAVGDIDGDGDLDALFTTNGGPAHLLRNDGAKGAAAFDLRGKGGNSRAIGAVVRVSVGEKTQVQMVRTGSSYLSHSPTTLTFGLGDAAQIDRLQIRWPDGSEEMLEKIEAGARYQVVQGKGIIGQTPFAGAR
jgi:enediyne biosynthesis protein E4